MIALQHLINLMIALQMEGEYNVIYNRNINNNVSNEIDGTYLELI